MGHTHGGHSHDSQRHGGAGGLGWELLDSIMLGCAVVVATLLAEMLFQVWRERRTAGVRYDLTPEGAAAATAPPPRTGEGKPLVDMDALRESVKRRDLGHDEPGQ